MNPLPDHSWLRNDPRDPSDGWVCSRCGAWMNPGGNGPPGPGPQNVAANRLYLVWVTCDEVIAWSIMEGR